MAKNMDESSRVPDDYRGSAAAYRAGRNDRGACRAAAQPATVPEWVEDLIGTVDTVANSGDYGLCDDALHVLQGALEDARSGRAAAVQGTCSAHCAATGECTNACAPIAPQPATVPEWVTSLSREALMSPMKSNFSLSRDEVLHLLAAAPQPAVVNHELTTAQGDGCGACGDGCSGGPCRLAQESPQPEAQARAVIRKELINRLRPSHGMRFQGEAQTGADNAARIAAEITAYAMDETQCFNAQRRLWAIEPDTLIAWARRVAGLIGGLGHAEGEAVDEEWRSFPYSAAWCDGLAATLRECGEHAAAQQIADIKRFKEAPTAGSDASRGDQ